MRVPTLAHRLLFPQALPVLAGKAKDGFLASAFRTLGENHALKVPFLGTGVMLDGQRQWDHPTGAAPGRPEGVVVIGVSIRSNAFLCECFQI
jgi:hypothetical protein